MAKQKKYYRDSYGGTASIEVSRNGFAVLRISTPQGVRWHNKQYATERSARIALGKLSGGDMKEV